MRRSGPTDWLGAVTRELTVVYEAPLFSGPGGGPIHYVGLFRGLGLNHVDVTGVLPSETSVETDQLEGTIHRLPARGGRALKMLTYEAARCILILRWFATGRRFDAWIARQSTLGFGLVLARLVARTVVLEVNGPISEEILANTDSRLMATIAEIALRVQLRASHLAVPVTEGLRDYLLAKSPNLCVRVLPNASDPMAFPLLPWSARSAQLTFVGALTPWYEVDIVLHALARLRDGGRDIDVHIVGDGIRRPELEGLVASLNIGSLVTFHGWLPPASAKRAMAESRVGLLPLRVKSDTLDAVGSPLKLYEYAAAGLRVVGTDIDGVRDAPVGSIVSRYQTGDVDSCVRAIGEALNSPPPALKEATWTWIARSGELIQMIQAIQNESKGR